MSRIAIIPVTFELLHKMLCLPEDAVIIGVSDDFGRHGKGLIKVEHRGLHKVFDGSPIPHVSPSIEDVDGKPVFKEWIQ